MASLHLGESEGMSLGGVPPRIFLQLHVQDQLSKLVNHDSAYKPDAECECALAKPSLGLMYSFGKRGQAAVAGVS